MNLEATEASIGRSGERICVIKVKLSGNKVKLEVKFEDGELLKIL